MRLALPFLLAVLALAGCGSGDGGGPSIDRGVAAKLAQAADAVGSASKPCAARDRALTLQSRTIAAINAGRIPDAYLEPLQSRVNEIVSELQVRCLPQPTPAVVETPQPPGRSRGTSDDHERKHGHGKHDG